MIDMIEKEDPFISEEEAAQYDRQIRLWGLDAQKRFVSINCDPDSQGQLNIGDDNFLPKWFWSTYCYVSNVFLWNCQSLIIVEHDNIGRFFVRKPRRVHIGIVSIQMLPKMVPVLADEGYT